MGLLFVDEQDAHDKVIDVPAGVSTGVVLLTRNGLTFRGAGKGVSIIKADTTRAWVFDAGTIVGGGPCTSVTLEDLTIDCDMIATLSAAIANNMTGGAQRVTLRRVEIRNYHRNSIAIGHGSIIDAQCVDLVGNGYAFNIQATSECTKIRDLTITGGSAGIGTAGADGTVRGIDIDGVDIVMDFWCSVSSESVTATAFSGQYVDVVSHVQAARSLYDVIRVRTPIGTFAADGDLPDGAQEFDYIEILSGDYAGAWAQVEIDDDGASYVGTWREPGSWNYYDDDDQPTGTATLYRVQIGKLYDYTATRLKLFTGGAELGRWRYVTGSPGVFSADAATDTCTMRGPLAADGVTEEPLEHGLSTGDAVTVATTDTLPGGLSSATYYAIRVSAAAFKLATSAENAEAGTAVAISSAGTGEHAVCRVPEIVAGLRVDILRHAIANPGSQTRDLDTGAVHITGAAISPRVRNVTIRGGFADEYTGRGGGNPITENITCDLGGDMGATIDGSQASQNVKRITVTRAATRGIYFTGGPSDVKTARVSGNGLADDGDGAYGVSGDLDADGSTISVVGAGGRSGAVNPDAPIEQVAHVSDIRARKARASVC